jgi:hypothetical protein
LAEAREALVSLFEARQRIHLLLIHRGAILWLVRNATASAAVKSLAALPDAAGKSPLRAALLRLNRGLQAAHPSTTDTVCVCSDGLPTLSDGQSAAAAGRSLRAAVKRLAQNSPARALWLSPAPTRAFQRWLDTLLSGSGVAWVRLAGTSNR